jgi:hypothetical protein
MYDHIVTIQEGELLEVVFVKRLVVSAWWSHPYLVVGAGHEDTARFMGRVPALINPRLQSSFSIGAIDAVADSDTMRQIESTIDKARSRSRIWSVKVKWVRLRSNPSYHD